ncbi:hypothetical protein [Streptomyces sp. NPDC005077]|uniref:hypothetical protein n=1 Tax=Streptomyces sp. NPDC005077 TaxID=3154292 RepID=UPI0033B7CEE2
MTTWLAPPLPRADGPIRSAGAARWPRTYGHPAPLTGLAMVPVFAEQFNSDLLDFARN